jgi:hypothetical protein
MPNQVTPPDSTQPEPSQPERGRGSRTERTPEQRASRRKRLLVGGLVALAVVLLVVIPGYLAQRPQFMSRYHKFSPQYESWATSVHAQVACQKCHVKPGFFPQMGYRVQALGQFYASLVSRANPPKAIGTPPTNDSCRSCHPDYRTVSPSGDLNIPHRAHVVVLKLKCIECHTDLVHTANAQGDHKPSMETCLVCHDGKKAKNACVNCHTGKAAPANHKAADWVVIHPTMQAKMDCEKCHGWTENWCAECHSRRPPSHVKKWRSLHGAAVNKRRTCEACHEAAFCIECHGELPKLNYDPALKLVR